MSKRFSDGYFALGLILGISVASVLGLLISDYGADCYLTDGNSYGYLAEGVGPDKRCWLIPFFVYGEDSLAQWLMAILTIVAVWMLWRTLELTRGANEAALDAARAAFEANDIIRGEQRPWVAIKAIESVNFAKDSQGEYTINSDASLVNVGKTPAFEVSIFARSGTYETRDELSAAAKDFIASPSDDELFLAKGTLLPYIPPDTPQRTVKLKDIEDSIGNPAVMYLVTYKTGIADEVGMDFKTFLLEARSFDEIPSGEVSVIEVIWMRQTK